MCGRDEKIKDADPSKPLFLLGQDQARIENLADSLRVWSVDVSSDTITSISEYVWMRTPRTADKAGLRRKETWETVMMDLKLIRHHALPAIGGMGG